MGIEEAGYRVVRSDGIFELRDYAPHILAETVVDGTLEDAGNQAFRRLFRYISGENRSRGKITMTAPVSQEAAGEKIPMTAPVGQQAAGGKWAVSFMMPASSTLATLPLPDDPAITLRAVPARRMAAVRYSGTWSESNYLQYKGGTGGVAPVQQPHHRRRAGLGSLQSPLHPLVPSAQRDPCPGGGWRVTPRVTR